jgi:catechol-2,3-dioxygenase
MSSRIISVVLRTKILDTTKLFFENNLGFKIKEYSHQHFVIHTKGIRIVFLESETELEPELYIETDITNCSNYLTQMVSSCI